MGRYVYAWLDDGAVFYIGKGVGDRVITRHTGKDEYPASCQLWRERIGERFSYVIIRDGLTDEGAELVESVLIDLLHPACNIAAPSSCRGQGVLTIPRTLFP